MAFDIHSTSTTIRERARAYGFACGISQAGFLEEEAPRLETWLKKGYHGKMSYMENHFDKRLDPRLLLEGCKSIISLSYNYFPEDDSLSKGKFKIARYAYGQDYHEVIKEILRDLVTELQEKIGDFSHRIFVDSAPVLERAWAKRAGLGWVGKNANIITKGVGSYFFLAEIFTDLTLEPDGPTTDHCGRCTRCLDACPTQAIVSPGVVDGSKCISYATIELKDQIPSDFSGKIQDWMFGCDICQEVCPWNRHSRPHFEEKFRPRPALLDFKDWEELSQETFSEIFRKSAVKRTKFSGLMRNIQFISKDRDTDTGQ